LSFSATAAQTNGRSSGDTLEFAFLVQSPGRGRLWGIDAPERNTEAGKASARNLEAVLPLNQPTRCVLHGREKFGGFLVEVFDHHGQSVNQLQLDRKFAKPWHGKMSK
jgi:endonuclease YncB( thermonuclease family)